MLCYVMLFAIKVESCQKSRQIFDVFFAFKHFCGGPLQKLYPRYHGCLLVRRLVKFRKVTLTILNVVGVNTLKFK